MLDAGKSLCSLLKMVFVAFPSEATSTPQDVKALYQKVEELIQKHLASVAAPQTAGEDNSASMISFVLYIIQTLAEVQKNVIDPFNLVRVLQRLARDLASAPGSYARQVCLWFLIQFLALHFFFKFFYSFCYSLFLTLPSYEIVAKFSCMLICD